MEASPLHPDHRAELLQLLRAEPDTNLFLIDILSRDGIRETLAETWIGIGDPVAAGAIVIGRRTPNAPARLVVPFGDPDAGVHIGRRIRQDGPVSMIIGPRSASDGIWQGLEQPTPTVHFDQRLYVCTEVSAGPRLPIRVARTADVPRLVPLAAEMMIEDLGVDPRIPDPELHQRGVASRCSRGRTLIAERDGRICFQLNIGTFSKDGTQIGGTYVHPDFRRQGLSTAGMRAASEALLSMTRCVSLHVNEANTPAVRCYERTGFVRAAPFRLIIK